MYILAALMVIAISIIVVSFPSKTEHFKLGCREIPTNWMGYLSK